LLAQVGVDFARRRVEADLGIIIADLAAVSRTMETGSSLALVRNSPAITATFLVTRVSQALGRPGPWP